MQARDQLGIVTRAFFAQRYARLSQLLNALTSPAETSAKQIYWKISTKVWKTAWKGRAENRQSTWVSRLTLSSFIAYNARHKSARVDSQVSASDARPAQDAHAAKASHAVWVPGGDAVHLSILAGVLNPWSVCHILGYGATDHSGLLLNLRDCGVPDLNFRTSRAKPTSLRSSDRGSLLRYMGLRESLKQVPIGLTSIQHCMFSGTTPSFSHTSRYSKWTCYKQHLGWSERQIKS